MAQKLLFGFHAVQARLRVAPRSVQEVYVEHNRADKRMQNFIGMLAQARIEPRLVERHRLDGLVGHSRHQGVAALVEDIPLAHSLDDVLENVSGAPFLLVLDGVTDPHNLGACLRTADAAGALAVIVPKDKSATLTPTVRKVACGAAEVIPLVAVTNLAATLKKLQQRGLWVVGTAGEAEQELYEQDLTGPTILIMGAEGKGMRRLTREHCDYLVRLPMAGSVSSLNVSVATGVCLFEALRQRGLKAAATRKR